MKSILQEEDKARRPGYFLPLCLSMTIHAGVLFLGILLLGYSNQGTSPVFERETSIITVNLVTSLSDLSVGSSFSVGVSSEPAQELTPEKGSEQPQSMSEIQSLSFQDLNKKEKLKEKPKIASEKKNVSRKRQPPTESHKNELENQTGKAQKEEALDIKREVVYESYGALSKPLASTTPMTKATSEEGSHSKEEVQTKRLEHDSSTSENMKSYPSGGEKVWTGEPEATGSFYAPDFGSYTKGGSIQDGGAGLESVSLAGNRSNPSEFGGIGQSVEEKEETASAKLVDFSKPDYPAYSRERGEEGTVTLAIEVYPNGAHGKIEIVRSSGYSRLDQAAIRAIEKASFLPAKVNGKPVSSVKQIVIRFQLEEAEN